MSCGVHYAVQYVGASRERPAEFWWGMRGLLVTLHLKLVVLSFNVADYKSGPQESAMSTVEMLMAFLLID